MRTRALIIITCAACAGLLWFIFRTHAATAELETRTLAAQNTKEKLRGELQRAQKTVVAPAPARTDSPAQPIPAESKTPPAKAPRPPGLMDLASDNPQLMNLWVANQRSRLQQRFGMLFQTLNLTAAERDKFKNIIAANEARSVDIGSAAMAQGIKFEDPVIKKLREDSQKQLQAELTAALGEKNFQTYQEFARTTGVRGFVDGFAVQMAMTEPITPAQAAQLAQALIAATPAGRFDQYVDPASVDWTSADRAAERLLSPTQFSAWTLGVAHNPAGGSRVDQELRKVYEAAKDKLPVKSSGK